MDTVNEINDKCYGCGAILQAQADHLPGYVPESILAKKEEKRLICKRCHRIKHYNEILKVTLKEEKFVNIISQIAKDSSVILYVIDLFDFEGSWLEQVPKYLSKRPVYVIVNKTDVLPRDINNKKITLWVKKELSKRGLQAEKVFLVSALKRWELDNVADAVLKQYADKNIYVVGATNVGKSTLINRLAPLLLRQEEQVKLLEIPEITTSVYSGTTVETLKIPLTKNTAIYDTPGIIKSERLTEQVCATCLLDVTPNKRIKARVFQLNDEQTLFLGGLARIDYISGEKQPFVFYVSNNLLIHRTKLENADNIQKNHTQEMLSPPCKDCENHLELSQVKTIDVPANQETDIVISGLGWVTIKGQSAKIKIHVPKTAEIRIRPALI